MNEVLSRTNTPSSELAAPTGIQKPESSARRDTLLLLAGQLGIGGAERHMILLANLLSKQFNVVIAYLKPGEEMLGELCRDSLVSVHCLHVSRRFDIWAARELSELAIAHGARVIVCANPYPLLYAHMARVLSMRPLLIMEIFHTTKPRTAKEWLSMIFYRPLFWAAHHMVFVCQAQRRYWTLRGLRARRTHMIYNGVDLAHFNEISFVDSVVQTRASLGFGADDYVVGICAALRREKAHADLVSAVANLRSEGRRWRLLIIGDGPMRGAIEQQVVSLGLADSIRITGFQLDVRYLLAACDVLALVSTSETFSIAALEAMAMSKPIIMSDVGGAREQVTHGEDGLLFTAGDVPALTNCLRQCEDRNRTRRMGETARRRVERDYSIRAMLDGYMTLFRKILALPQTSASR